MLIKFLDIAALEYALYTLFIDTKYERAIVVVSVWYQAT